MTFEELNEVRRIKTKLTHAEKMLDIWRRASTVKTSATDGLPKSQNASSQVERLALKIIDAEKRVEYLQKKISQAKIDLEQKIRSEFQNEKIQALLTLRYVDCMFFCDIADIMRYSEQYIYRLHKKILSGL